jgi:hypothetical protein
LIKVKASSRRCQLRWLAEADAADDAEVGRAITALLDDAAERLFS